MIVTIAIVIIIFARFLNLQICLREIWKNKTSRILPNLQYYQTIGSVFFFRNEKRRIKERSCPKFNQRKKNMFVSILITLFLYESSIPQTSPSSVITKHNIR